MPELSKYITSESVEIERSSIKFASYNPRTLSTDEKKTLKRGIKKFGMVGGLVVNKRTGMTVVSGHQRLSVMDELNGYPKKDYAIRVDVIDVDEKQEKELNILLNNPNAQGKWDYDALREIIPDINYKDAGLTDVDLNLIGCDFLLQTAEEVGVANEIEELMAPVEEQKKQQREQDKLERNERIAHMKDVKAQVRESAQKQVDFLDAYVTLSFDTYEAKASFCQRFGYEPETKILKGEVFDGQVERIE